MREAVSSSLHNLILTNKSCLQCDLQWIGVIQNCLMGIAFEVSRRHTKLHAFAKQFMGVVRRPYACTQTCEVEVCFTTKVLRQLKTNKKGLYQYKLTAN